MLGTFLDTGAQSASFHVRVLPTSHASSLSILCFMWNISTSYTRQAVSHGHAFTPCCSCCLGLLSSPPWLTLFCLSDLAGAVLSPRSRPCHPSIPSLARCLSSGLSSYSGLMSIVKHTAIEKPTLKECFLCSRNCTKQLTCINAFNLHNVPIKWDSL